jgi:hypothetical protein
LYKKKVKGEDIFKDKRFYGPLPLLKSGLNFEGKKRRGGSLDTSKHYLADDPVGHSTVRSGSDDNEIWDGLLFKQTT